MPCPELKDCPEIPSLTLNPVLGCALELHAVLLDILLPRHMSSLC